jgi:hypothetical protein
MNNKTERPLHDDTLEQLHTFLHCLTLGLGNGLMSQAAYERMRQQILAEMSARANASVRTAKSHPREVSHD